jgi:NAD(P)-dependent dehydrogenase (short-subunit alcohol dehydrogenase family)
VTRLADMMNMTDRVALVTGAAGHLGRAIGDGLAELGASIVVLDLEAARCATEADRLRATYGVPTMPLAVDLANDAEVRGVAEAVAQRFGRLDVLVNNAAMVGTSELTGWVTGFDDQSVETWRKAIDVNLTAPFALAQACVPLLTQSSVASIVNIASIYAISGPDRRLYEGTSLGNPAAYAASKAGLMGLTRWLATTLAPAIRVNAIVCGGIERGQDPSFVARYEARTPLGRMAVEADFKGAMAFLASDMSRYVTGHGLVVDGGWTAW